MSMGNHACVSYEQHMSRQGKLGRPRQPLPAPYVLVQRELDNPPIVLSNSLSGFDRERFEPCLPPAGVLGLGSGTTGGRPFRPVASTPPVLG